MSKAEVTTERDRTSAPPTGPRGLRKWLFRLAVMVLAPALVLGLTEGSLRLFGYGYPTSFFQKIPGQEAYTSNPRFAWRFFQRAHSYPPVPFRMSAVKPEGTVRIFVLGGSAARGLSEAGSVSRILQVMLREQFPHARFEVVNAAMPAINSHVVLPIARDCADHEPDLFIVYLGNNEATGPFGAGTSFSGFSPSLPAIRASLWLRTTKVGQLIQSLASSISGNEAVARRTEAVFLEQPVAEDDPRLDKVVEHFRTNLMDICAIASDVGAPVILCTVATNLKDCPPFLPMHRPGLGGVPLAAWQTAYDAGIKLENAGEYDRAVQKYLEAEKLDDRFADLHFRIGRCDLAAGRTAEARERFILARDLDAMRFRTDTRLNAAIREVAAARQGGGVVLVDAERRLAESPMTRDGILGSELIYDQVHLNFNGNYEVARAVFEAVSRQLPATIHSGAAAPQPLTKDRCAELLALSVLDHRNVALQMWYSLGRPPFTNQLDHAQRGERRAHMLRELQNPPTLQEISQAIALCRQVLQRNPDNLHVRRNLATRLYDGGEHAESAEQWRALLERIPQDAEAKVELGAALLALDRIDEAMAEFREGIDRSHKPELLGNRVGMLLLTRGKVDEAIARFRAVLREAPGLAGVRGNLGMALFAKKRYEEAIVELSELVRLHGDDARARGNLAVVLIQVRRIDEAIPHLLEAVRIDPFHPTAYEHLAEVMAYKGQREEAAQYLDAAERITPDSPDVRRNFAAKRLRLGLRPLPPETQPDPARTPR